MYTKRTVKALLWNWNSISSRAK